MKSGVAAYFEDDDDHTVYAIPNTPINDAANSDITLETATPFAVLWAYLARAGDSIDPRKVDAIVECFERNMGNDIDSFRFRLSFLSLRPTGKQLDDAFNYFLSATQEECQIFTDGCRAMIYADGLVDEVEYNRVVSMISVLYEGQLD